MRPGADSPNAMSASLASARMKSRQEESARMRASFWSNDFCMRFFSAAGFTGDWPVAASAGISSRRACPPRRSAFQHGGQARRLNILLSGRRADCWGGSCTATPVFAVISGVAVQLPPQHAILFSGRRAFDNIPIIARYFLDETPVGGAASRQKSTGSRRKTCCLRAGRGI